MITYDEFAKVEIKVGKILSAEKIPDTDKLLKLEVDFGVLTQEQGAKASMSAQEPVIAGETAQEVSKEAETKETVETRDIRQIVSGISLYFPDPATLVGRKCMFVTNLEPRKIRGHDSNGMLFAVSTPEGAFSLLEPNDAIPEGTKAK
jgi:tRNA-binding EMAP/Myf-like protein